MIDLSREISQQSPREMEFYTTLGDAWGNSGKPKQAIAAFEQAISRSPNSVTALQSLAEAQKASGHLSQSEETLQRALRLAPENANVLVSIQHPRYRLGRVRLAALEKMQKAVALNPDLPGAISAWPACLLAAGQIDPAVAASQQRPQHRSLRCRHLQSGRPFAGRNRQTPEAAFRFRESNAASSRLWTLSLRLCLDAGSSESIR